MAEKYYYGRVGHVSIEDKDGTMHDYGDTTVDKNLDFKFKIKRSRGVGRISAHIDILGLSHEQIDSLIYWGPEDRTISRLRKIQVFAGYRDSGEVMIYEGYVISARPSPFPENWLSIESDQLQLADAMMNVTFSETPIKGILKSIAKFYKKGFNWDNDIPEKVIGQYIANKPLDNLLNDIEKLDDNVMIRLEGGTIYAKFRGTKKIDTTISAENGLMLVEEVSFTSMIFKMRLEPDIRTNDILKIESTLYPSLSGNTWEVYQVEHIGHLRGNEWETRVITWSTEETKRKNTKRPEKG